MLRGGLSLYPDDEVKNAAHYLRFNTHKLCPLPLQEEVPDVPLFSLEGSCRLAELCTGRTVLLAGSYT